VSGTRRRLAWLRPPHAEPGGVMSLADHLRELRYRLLVSSVAIVVAACVAAVWFNQLYLLLMQPYLRAVDILKENAPNLNPTTVISGVTAPFILVLQVSLIAGLVVSSPIWLYQLWAFIAPALVAKEKRYALGFLSAAIPLFLLGVVIGYLILPQGIWVMLSFTPATVPVTNLLAVDEFLKLTMQLMVIFGLGFLMPVVVVGANLIGVVRADQLAKARTYVIFATFVFGAVATPSTDPFSMLALALPMVVLYLIAELICRLHDRRKAKETAEAH
jgi:Twin arginine targeting (Tat) protein translocase TatC